MTPAEKVAYNAGVRAVLDMARTTATAMERSPGTHHVRTRAAIAALSALADGAQALLIGPKPEGAAVLQTGCESSDQDDGI
jgi:hypothetical protein